MTKNKTVLVTDNFIMSARLINFLQAQIRFEDVEFSRRFAAGAD
jgi:hypothetical protein